MAGTHNCPPFLRLDGGKYFHHRHRACLERRGPQGKRIGRLGIGQKPPEPVTTNEKGIARMIRFRSLFAAAALAICAMSAPAFAAPNDQAFVTTNDQGAGVDLIDVTRTVVGIAAITVVAVALTVDKIATVRHRLAMADRFTFGGSMSGTSTSHRHDPGWRVS